MKVKSMFKIGEMVVHPQRGIGQIFKLEEREFEPGVTKRYYEVSIPGGSTVWVPADAPKTGLRKLASKQDIMHCREILHSEPAPLGEDARARQSDLVTHLKKGTIAAQCEVVRDLAGHIAHKPTSGSIADFLRVTENVLSQEWAMVEGMSIHEAEAEIHILLGKGQGKEVPAE
jgi:RNA polymerase-interacting CarD/CdnL/TRCF family regulator